MERKSDGGSEDIRRRLTLARSVVEFVVSDGFRGVAESGAESVWLDLVWDCQRMLLSRHFSEWANTSSASELVVTGAFDPTNGVALRSLSSLAMPTIWLSSGRFSDRLKPFRQPNWARQLTPVEVQNKIMSVLREYDTTDEGVESVAFMAYVFGMLDEWDRALSLIESVFETSVSRPRKSPRGQTASEVSYLYAFAKRRVAQDKISSEPGGAAELCAGAFGVLTKLLETDESDARFVKERATVALVYAECRAALGQGVAAKNWNTSGLPFGVETAKAELRKALQLAERDARLRLEILNNLAYAETMSKQPDFAAAIVLIETIDDYLHRAGLRVAIGELEPLDWPPLSDPLLDAVLPGLRDTALMVRAHVAQADADYDIVRRCAAGFDEMLANWDLTASQIRTLTDHRDTVNSIARECLRDSAPGGLAEAERAPTRRSDD